MERISQIGADLEESTDGSDSIPFSSPQFQLEALPLFVSLSVFDLLDVPNLDLVV